MRFRTMLAASGIVAAFLLTVPSIAARAAGECDGTWVIDFPAVTSGANFSQPDCQALRLHFLVKDSQVTARLQRIQPVGNVIENSDATGATPVTGAVQPDGTVRATWGNFVATGRLAGTEAQVFSLQAKDHTGPL